MCCVLWPQKHSKNKEYKENKNKEIGGDFLAPKDQLSHSGSTQWWSAGTADVILAYRQDRISLEGHRDAVWSLTRALAAQPRRKQNLTAQPYDNIRCTERQDDAHAAETQIGSVAWNGTGVSVLWHTFYDSVTQVAPSQAERSKILNRYCRKTHSCPM